MLNKIQIKPLFSVSDRRGRYRVKSAMYRRERWYHREDEHVRSNAPYL